MVTGARPRVPRLPAAANLVAALAMLILVAFFAITAHNQSPPAIAEFAPQAQQTIKQAPSEQSGNAGSAPGSATGAAPLPSPSPSPLPTDVVYKRCVGDPPRQTEDPQSPPCVPYWKGDNGGVTSKGVSGQTITIAYADPGGNAYDGGGHVAYPALQRFFNERFEFYGRTINIVPYTSSGQADTNQVADAATVDETIHAFAALPGASYVNANDGSSLAYQDALASRHVISVLGEPVDASVTEGHLAANAPYEWSFDMPLDTAEYQLSELICKGLRGRPPRFAGKATVTNTPRVFGVIQEVASDGQVIVDDALISGMAQCGIHPTVVRYQGGDGTATNYTTAIATLQSNHVTTVTCLCNGNDNANYWGPYAESAGYQPEWLIPGALMQDMDDQGEQMTTEASAESAQRFGISGLNKMLPVPEMPWWWAVKEGDPTATQAQYQAANYSYGAQFVYWALLVVASGIQLAGPDLTPATFERGLQRALFPDPRAGVAPYYQASVGYGGGSHAFIKSVAPIWWGSTADSTYAYVYGAKGAWCYVDHGVRYQLGQWPNTEPNFFQGTCQ